MKETRRSGVMLALNANTGETIDYRFGFLLDGIKERVLASGQSKEDKRFFRNGTLEPAKTFDGENALQQLASTKMAILYRRQIPSESK